MFLISIGISIFYFVLAIFINLNWIHDIACYLGYPLAIYLVLFVALVPGFIFIFALISLLCGKKKKKRCCKRPCDVTILIPVYNACDSIRETIESIQRQKYCGRISVVIIDDGSTDSTLEVLESLHLGYDVKVLKLEHRGKAAALNEGLKEVKTNYTITLDSDTVLHPDALQNVMDSLTNADPKTAATAGCIFVKNDRQNFIAKLQQWDYTLGIFGVKLYQGEYSSTLVAQGAFSAYKTNVLQQIGGWKSCVGEDIVLTWELLSIGYQTNFAKDAISFTQVPSTLKGLFRQRKRWARGMIEAFKKVPVLTSKQMNWKSKILMLFNVLFPFVDLALLIFVLVGLLFLIFGNQLLIGWLTLFVVLLGLILCLVIEVRRCNALRQVECKLERRSFFSFLFYVLLYAFILAPACIIGYCSELFNVRKKW